MSSSIINGAPPLPAGWNEWPRISVILPIRNEERYIEQTLHYILGQDYPPDRLEVLVVDGESTDRTRSIVEEIAATHTHVRLLTNPDRLSSAARAIGAREATGEIITYVDGHVYIDNRYVLKHTAALMQTQKVSVLSRPQFLHTPSNSPFQDAVAWARRSPLGHGLDSTIYMEQDGFVEPGSSGASYRREVFDIVGNFDIRFDACEDVEFNTRVAKAGFRSFTSMKLAVYYFPRETLAGLLKQTCRYGQGRCRLARKHPSTLGAGTLIPFAIVCSPALVALAGLIHTSLWWLGGLILAFYLLAIVLTSVGIAAKRRWEYLLRLPAIFLVIHIGLGWGFGVELWQTITGKAVSFNTQ